MNQAEDLLAFQLRAVGIEFVQQYIYAPPRRLRADFAFLRPRGLLCEIQGGIFTKTRNAHGSITGILADIDRLNAATLAGWRLIRATPDMVRDGRALKLIEAALRPDPAVVVCTHRGHKGPRQGLA